MSLILPADHDLRRRVELVTGVDGPAPVAVCTPFGPYVYNHILRGSGERFGVANGSGVRVAPGPLGLGAGATTQNTNAFQLHSTAFATDTVWESPVGGNQVTVLAYLVRYGNAAGNAPIFAVVTATHSPYYIWGLTDQAGSGNLELNFNNGTVQSVIASGALVNNRPLVCVGVYNGATATVYVNGAVVASASISGNITGTFSGTSPADRGPAIGNFWNYTGGNRSFIGDVHVASLWDKAISHQQVQQITARLLGSRGSEVRRIWVPVSAGSGTTVTPDAGVLTLAGLTPAVTVDHLLRPSTGVLALEGQAPTVVVGANVQPSTGALTFEGLAPTAVATDNHVAAPAPGAATLTGLAPTVVATDHHTVEPSAGALTLAGLQPAAVTGGNVVAQPEPGALVLAGLQPTIAASDNRSAQPSAGELALTGLAPTVTVTENVIVNPLTGALIFTGLAPTVLVSDNRVVQPGAGALSFEGLVPEIPVSSPTVEPGVGALALEGLAPTVVTTGAESVATDPKLIARWPNVRVDFGTRKKTPEPTPAPAKITNMPGHPPVPRPLAGGLLAALDSLPPAPPTSPKAAPAPVKTLAPTPAPTAAPTQSLAPPAPAAAPAVVPAPLVPTPVPVAAGITPEQMTALLQRMDALSEGVSSRLVEVNKGLQADIERVTQLLEAERDARLAREKRELNEARAKEITARLLGSGG